jgi:hypothetical protein
MNCDAKFFTSLAVSKFWFRTGISFTEVGFSGKEKY